MQSTLIPATVVLNETARRLADQKLLERFKVADGERALGSALTQVEKDTRRAEVRRQIEDMRKRQAETNKRVRDIEAKLVAELERARKAQAAAQNLSFVSSALTLGAQAAQLKAELGPDAPAAEIDAATSPADLQEIANRLATEAQRNGDALQVEYRAQTDAASGVRTESLRVLRDSHYPVHNVPELKQLERP
jgi:hypothetical protein